MQGGHLLDGRFEIVGEVSSGGMGTVLRARDRARDVMVAVKVMTGGDARDRERFEREASILAALDHAGIVGYVTHGRTPASGPYLVEELIEGESLGDRLGRTGLSVRESLVLLRRICGAAAVAHAAGVVHRDLKPDNILLRGGRVEDAFLIDFGIARPVRETGRLTQTGMVIGTPGYLAPEQALGHRDIDARADVFALGCILFECATGRPAFAGRDQRAVMAKVLLLDVPSLSSIASEVGPELDALAAGMLSRDRAKRPADAGEVARALDELPTATDGPRRPFAIPAGPTRQLSGGRRPARASDAMAIVMASPGVAFPSSITADARVERLNDGSMLISIHGREVMRAACQAAGIAVELGANGNAAGAVSVITARATELGRADSLGQLVDRCARQLDFTAPGTIRIDGATAGWIDGEFDVSGGAGGFCLRGRA